EGVTLFMGLLAAFQVMLSKYTGQEDVAVGTAIANRNRVETEGLIGFFVNSLVMRTNLGGQPSFQEVLRRVRQMALETYRHQDETIEKLVEELQPERDLSRTPLFQVMLVLQNTGQAEIELPRLNLSEFPLVTGTAKFELLLVFGERERKLVGEASYSRDLYES